MPVYEYREIPTSGPEVGGDELYLGESAEVPGPLLPYPPPIVRDADTGAGDGTEALEVYVHPQTKDATTSSGGTSAASRSRPSPTTSSRI